jgi:hypothetical protein
MHVAKHHDEGGSEVKCQIFLPWKQINVSSQLHFTLRPLYPTDEFPGSLLV